MHLSHPSLLIIGNLFAAMIFYSVTKPCLPMANHENALSDSANWHLYMDLVKPPTYNKVLHQSGKPPQECGSFNLQIGLLVFHVASTIHRCITPTFLGEAKKNRKNPRGFFLLVQLGELLAFRCHFRQMGPYWKMDLLKYRVCRCIWDIYIYVYIFIYINIHIQLLCIYIYISTTSGK